MSTAAGTFTVKLPPLDAHPAAATAGIGRRAIDKLLLGDLAATSAGEMLAVFGSDPSSAVYVALEVISGSLHGRDGTFALHHTGVSDRGAQHARIEVVPDSGTGALVGLRGTFAIRVESGVHHYTFDYTLPDAPPA
jgi:hypothetical protein